MTGPGKYCESDGVRIDYVSWPGSRPELGAVLLVPGMAAPASYWVETPGMVDCLREGGARAVIAVSLRGRGRSGCPGTGWTPEHHHGDLAAVLVAEGVARCHLIGHSAGGVYALGLALGKPGLAASVTMGDYPPVLGALTGAWVRRLEAWAIKEFHPEFPRRLAAESRRVAYSQDLQRLEAPLLVVRGMGETSLLGDDQLSLFRGARRLEIIQVQAGHDVFRSRQAQEACAAFIARADA
jgi:pimeloyl-ACP methyl ester carboxylesterase